MESAIIGRCVNRARLGLLLTLVTLGACKRSGGENLGLTRQQGPIDLRHLARPSELVRALAQPGGARDRLLGAYRFTATSTLKTEPPGAAAEVLEEVYALDSDGRGAVHLVHDNSHGYGVEAVVTGGELYIRPRFGTFVRRHPEGGEVERLRANVEGVAGDYLGLFARWLSVRELGPSELGGRRAVRLQLSALPQPSGPSDSDQRTERLWRDTLAVRSLDGELTLDAESAVPLAIRLTVSYTFTQKNNTSPTSATLTYQAELEPPQAITPPSVSVTPHRSRPLLERQELLGGLARPRKEKAHD